MNSYNDSNNRKMYKENCQVSSELNWSHCKESNMYGFYESVQKQKHMSESRLYKNWTSLLSKIMVYNMICKTAILLVLGKESER